MTDVLELKIVSLISVELSWFLIQSRVFISITFTFLVITIQIRHINRLQPQYIGLSVWRSSDRNYVCYQYGSEVSIVGVITKQYHPLSRVRCGGLLLFLVCFANRKRKNPIECIYLLAIFI